MPFEYDPAEKNRHKFMVQSAIVPEDYNSSMEELFHTLGPDQTMDSKLRCVFVLAEDSAGGAVPKQSEPPSEPKDLGNLHPKVSSRCFRKPFPCVVRVNKQSLRSDFFSFQTTKNQKLVRVNRMIYPV